MRLIWSTAHGSDTRQVVRQHESNYIQADRLAMDLVFLPPTETRRESWEKRWAPTYPDGLLLS